MAAVLQGFFWLFMIGLCLFMIMIILIQRGKGGGLAGAFGGMGGNSVFGTKSSDVFLRITVVTAVIWFVAMLGGRYILTAGAGGKTFLEGVRTTQSAVATPDAGDGNTTAPATSETAAPTPASDEQQTE